MDILIWDGTQYNRKTYDKTIIQNFKQKFWYLCSRSAIGELIIDDSQKAFTNFLNMKNN